MIIARHNGRRAGSERPLEVFIVFPVAAVGHPLHWFEPQGSSSEDIENATAVRIRNVLAKLRTLQDLADFGFDCQGKAENA